ncbi:MAG: Na+/H+ antiporter subunit C [Steroidobacteraceae bacterium]|jgi:multicomponent K+:H+ antiporter subunit C|nr:Na+/H+ antiporter subunit C [Steroidobacteraceae bacterium]
MEWLLALAIGVLVAGGVWLCLREHVFPVLLGLTLVSYAVNLFLLASGRLTLGSAPLVDVAQAEYPDPLPQALVLTAIVIGFAMTAFLVALALQVVRQEGVEHVDGAAGEQADAASPERDGADGAGR